MTETRSYLQNGTKLDQGRFEITSPLGQGGFGLTYKAMDHHDKSTVVIKEYYPPETADRREGKLIFFDEHNEITSPVVFAIAEAFSAGRVSHPAVAKVIKTFSENETAYIAMEWIEGHTLLEACRLGLLSPSDLRKVYLTVLDAILHFSSEGFAHRDLNFNNIMIRRDREPVVIDFGLARAVGPGFTHLTRTAALMSTVAPSEQFDPHGNQGVWTDVYALSASLFYVILGRGPKRSRDFELRNLYLRQYPLLSKFDLKFLEVIDEGLIETIDQRLQSGEQALRTLGLTHGDLANILHPDVLRKTLLTQPITEKVHIRGPSVKISRYQRCLLQSFDTARFQPSSVRRKDATALHVDEATKIALARTEAVLNVLFGREIIVPAGQVAESPAFRQLFCELIPAYTARRDAIAAACKQAGLPVYKPMRLALERPESRDYVGFVKAYRYTGAPLIIMTNGGKSKTDAQAEISDGTHRVEGFKQLFLADQYERLEHEIKQKGYGEFARGVKEYFTHETAVFADNLVPEVSVSDYRKIFETRLNDATLQGEGIEEAREKLSLVQEIESDLSTHAVAGYRGNWYQYAARFEGVWPLARAYLDLKLFLTLTRQYGVDHPILISQEFEYGRFDHSLILGPKFASNLQSKDGSLLDLSSHFTSPIDWGTIFDLFTRPDFLTNLRWLNRFYFARESAQDYIDMTWRHGQLINEHVRDIMTFSSKDDHMHVGAGTQRSGGVMSYDTYDPIGLTDEARKRDKDVAASVLPQYGSISQQHLSVGALRTGAADTSAGNTAAREVLHYFAKPYQLLAEGNT